VSQLPPERRGRGWHRIVDRERAAFANCMIGAAVGPLAGVLGNPLSVLYRPFFYTARIIRFPECQARMVKSGSVRGGC